MTLPDDLERRSVMTALASLPLMGCAAGKNNNAEMRQLGSRTLVAYFSRSSAQA